MDDGSNTFRKLDIPPLLGRPKRRNINNPQYTPSNMWLVHIDARGNRVEKLRIQTVPLEINVAPTANWVVIPSIGRNNPFYHYTGGEDVVKFTLDWYSVHPLRQDVIFNCRWVESLSRANGYKKEPPRVLLIFGDLFNHTEWIVESAPYRLSLFDREKQMLPRQAYQELTLKKVTDHSTGMMERRYLN